MEIRWHGHACFEIGDGLKIVIDPHDGRSIGIKVPKVRADVVLVTHYHFDHDATRVVQGKFDVIDSPGKYEVRGVVVKGILAYHDEVYGKKRGSITMFKIESEGIKLLHVGDLGHILTKEQLEEIGEVDILFVPVGGVYTVDAKKAYENTKKINPKVVVPMHYRLAGMSLSIGPLDEFLKLYPENKIEYVGNSVFFTYQDLPQNLEVWVFTL